MALDPLTIVPILCSLGCCLLSLVVILGGIALVLRRSGGEGSTADKPSSGRPSQAAEKTPASAPSTPVVRGRDEIPDDFSDDFEEEMATVVAPPPPGLGRRAPVAPPPPPPSKPSAGESLPPPPAPRSSGQTIIAFDDDFDDEDDD